MLSDFRIEDRRGEDLSIRYEKTGSKDTRPSKDLSDKFEGALSLGRRVAAVISSPDPIPEYLRLSVIAKMTLPAATHQMFMAMMEIHFSGQPVSLDLSDRLISQIPAFALTSVFASEDMGAAMGHLDRITARCSRADGVTLDNVYGQPPTVKDLRQLV